MQADVLNAPYGNVGMTYVRPALQRAINLYADPATGATYVHV